jgi:hypothetical protein
MVSFTAYTALAKSSGTLENGFPKFQYLIRIKLHTCSEYIYCLSFDIMTYKRKTLFLM